MKNQPFIIPLLGIIIGTFFSDSFSGYLVLVFFVLILLAYILSFLFSGFHKSFSFGILVIFTLIGSLNFKIHNYHKSIPDDLLENPFWINLEIKEIYRPSEKFCKYKAQIISVDSVKINRNSALLYWRKNYEDLNPGDKIWVKAKIQPAPVALNPYQFDYAKFLKRQRIDYMIFSDFVFHKEKSGRSFPNSVARFKKEVYNKFIQNGYSKNAADIIGAMLLGDRNEMDKEVEDQYRKTGVVHILSISGLHVMMVYSIFMIVLYPIVFLPKGKLLRISVCLVFIWAYAFFVGLQPPVLRSALMISIYYLSVAFNRKSDIYHTLMVSAFILLLINPNFFFDVGFQLSFSAVFFIVWLMPVFTKIIKPKRKIGKITTGFLGTSIAAQLGTFPFSAYYFNQTSGLFLAGNLIMILASYFMIVGGIISVGLACFDFFPKSWTMLFNFFIRTCNDYIEWLSGFDLLIFEKISFNVFEVILILTGVIFLRYILLNTKFQNVIFFLGLILIFESENFYRAELMKNKQEIIVFHQNRNSILGIRNGKNMDVFVSDLNDSTRIKKFILNPYTIHEQISEVNLFSMNKPVHSFYYKNRNVLLWKNKKIMIPEKNNYSGLSKADFIIIRNNTKIDISSIPDSAKIIVDGSNYPNYLSEEKEVWKTRKNGAFVLTQER